MQAINRVSQKGSVISGFRVIETVRTGPTAEVYYCRSLEDGKSLAVKFLDSRRTSSGNDRQRFDAEVKIASSLVHDNICPVLDWGVHSGVPFYVMPWLVGSTLSSLLDRRSFTVDAAIGIAIQTLKGLGAAHSAGVVHRDIKPSNLMVRKRRGRATSYHVSILDFGVSKLMNEKFTRTGITVGTPAYMAPELLNAKNADTRTDIYSTGVVLYEMLTGDVPYDGESSEEILRKRAIEAFQSPGSLSPVEYCE